MGVVDLVLVEGLLIGLLVAMRMVCLRVTDLDELPRGVVRRIEIGNRLAPWVGSLAVVAVVVGLAMRVGGV